MGASPPRAQRKMKKHFASKKPLTSVKSGRILLDPEHRIDPEVPVTAESECIVACPAVRVHEAPALDRAERLTQQRFRRAVRDHGDLDPAVAFENAEDGDLRRGASAALPPAVAGRLAGPAGWS